MVEQKAQSSRSEILRATAEIILRTGYESCTMRAVASRINMKPGSIYYHFRSKDEIIEEILNQGIENLFNLVSETIDQLPADTAFAAKIEAAINAHLSGIVGKDRTYMHVYEHLPPIIKRRSKRMREKYAQLWTGLFAEGVARGEFDAAADLTLLVPYFLGGLNRVPEWIRSSGSDSETVSRLATGLLLKGILARS